MLFNSFTFLAFIFAFVPAYAISLRLGPSFYKYILLLFSYLFYGWAYPPYILLIILSTLIDYVCGIKMSQTGDKKQRKKFLLVSVISNLGLLGYFKYTNFMISSIQSLGFGSQLSYLSVILPVGISFYTFQSMSYSIDVYRDELKAEKNFLDFAVYISFFPQLVAGPIVLARDFLIQLKTKRVFNQQRTFRGLFEILCGFTLKSVIADNLALGVDQFFNNPEHFSTIESWYYCYGYSMQIFGDFAGYSYVAIGISRIIGFDIPINFNYPYISQSITEFWRRWHISLSKWLKNYLYISLGGNRLGPGRTYLNLIITMLLGGLWHGANWNFMIWGGIHGIWLSLEKKLFLHYPQYLTSKNPLFIIFKTILTFHIVLLSWVFFRTSSISHSMRVFQSLFRYKKALFVGELLDGKTFFALIFLFHVIFFLRQFDFFKFKISDHQKLAVEFFMAFLMIHLCITMSTNSGGFIYFQF